MEQLPARHTSIMRPDGMAGAPAQARTHRSFLPQLAALVLSSCAVVCAAQDYPSRPVRVIVAFTAGGTTDVLARSIGAQLAERFRQPFVVDNRPGAGGNIVMVPTRERCMFTDAGDQGPEFASVGKFLRTRCVEPSPSLRSW
jgi:hypothetical protein